MFESVRAAWQTLWACCGRRTGVDFATYKSILKDTLAPAIGLAANQARPWSDVFGTIGFIVPMASIISRPSPSRAEFLKLWMTNILGSCVSAAVTALASFCVIKAREQSAGPAINPVPYNTVASTVAAIWLIVQTYIISAIRYNYPWTSWMTSACLIFSNYGMVYVVQFADMSASFKFLKQLLLAHMIGFGISAGVSLVIFPTSSRELFFETVLACTEEIRIALRFNIELMEYTTHHISCQVPAELDSTREIHKRALDSLQTKLVSQVGNAMDEIAWSRLSPSELKTLTQLLEDIIIPLIGLRRVPDILERTLWADDSCESDQKQSREQFRKLLSAVIDTFSEASTAVSLGLKHSEMNIGFKDTASFAEGLCLQKHMPSHQLENEIERLLQCKGDLLNAWNTQRRELDDRNLKNGFPDTDYTSDDYDQSRKRLHMLLYTELLLWSICRRVHELLSWTTSIGGSDRRKHLMIPECANLKALRRGIRSWMKGSNDNGSKREKADHCPTSFSHSPLKGFWMTALLLFRDGTQFFASPASGFALRVTCATMSIAIVAYLPSTQNFYINQHLVWAQYAVSFAMQGSAGQGVRALVFRMGGTIVAVCLAWVSWYIVVGIPAGVLVFYWLSLHFPMYILDTRPRFSTVGSVSAFALTTILGNALQPRGSDQPVIILGAVRLAALARGCLLATIWTLLPFPVTEYDGAKTSLSACLECLAQYHTGFHEIVRLRLRDNMQEEKSAHRNRELERLHSGLFAKCNSHLQSLQAQLRLPKWNVPVGSATFSHHHYERASQKIDDLTRNMQLIVFSTGIFIGFINDRPPHSTNHAIDWLAEFGNLFSAAEHNGLGAAALLGLLSHSIRNDLQLPPKLNAPRPEALWKYFDDPRQVALQVQRVDEQVAAMFALMRIGIKGLYEDLAELLQTVREAVAEYEFVCGFAIDEEA